LRHRSPKKLKAEPIVGQQARKLPRAAAGENANKRASHRWLR